MDHELKIINPLDYPSWNELLLSTPGSTFFHTSNWARVLCESYNYKPAYFTLIDKGILKVLVPLMEIRSLLTGNRGVSLPFSDYCEPLVDKELPFDAVLRDLIDYGKKAGWKSFELRGGGELLKDAQPSALCYEHILDLRPGKDQVLSSFRDSTRRNIKKATRQGVQVKIGTSLSSLNEFCRLNGLTKKKHGLPTQPHYFFEKIYEHILDKGHGFVALASINGRTIASAVYFHNGKKAIFKYGASDSRYHSLRANNLVMWKAIEWCIDNGYKSLCLGKTRTTNLGLRQFKNGWGTLEIPLRYYKYDLAKEVFLRDSDDAFSLLSMPQKRVPASLLNLVGTVFYRHIG